MDLQHLFDSPDLFLFAYEGGGAVFAQMDREAYHRSIFLDRRFSPKNTGAQRASLASLYAAQDSVNPPLGANGYIFHIAHCGSTLLARALDLPASNLVLREPMALRQLGVQAAAYPNGPYPDAWTRRARLLSALLSRRYDKTGPAIIKANVPVNFMINPLLDIAPTQPALFLHFSLENYLPAILHSDERRAWVQHISNELRTGFDALVGGRAPEASPALDAARIWLAQMLIYARALERYPNAASLDAETLFNAPAATMAAAFAHFGQPQDGATIDAIVDGELFSRYSKDPKLAFDNAQRSARQKRLKEDMRADLDAARAWVMSHPAAQGLPARLSKPLLGEGSALIEGAHTR